MYEACYGVGHEVGREVGHGVGHGANDECSNTSHEACFGASRLVSRRTDR